MSTYTQNTVKHKLKNGKKTMGGFLQITSPISAEIMAQCGFDWLIVDMEHAPGDFGNLQSQLQAMNGSGVVPFARVPWNDMVAIKRTLDTGVMGVLIPYVNTPEEAEAAVAACKYPPEGVRGVAGSPRAAGYTRNMMPYLTSANEEVVVMIAVETMEAVQNLDKILAVDGLDGIFIGPVDLASSMGFLGDPTQPEVQEAIALIESKVLSSDKFLGTIAANWDKAIKCFEKGYQWMILMQDSVAIKNTGDKMVNSFRSTYGDG
ncbi:MAG: 2,4-dihydroxyhept-2-ene-1,7-dioic acid aldolase [Gammaproteobacteria bacterium]|nr:2,4-dihydroxyhept-2-ene-1,7-dioic acid aldolase [Gammaproteobacteria bacterium]